MEIWSELQLDFVRSELMFLAENGVDTDWWTGATDLGREGHWYWVLVLQLLGTFCGTSQQTNPMVVLLITVCFWKTVGVMNFMAMIMAVQNIPVFFICQKK